MPDRATDRQRTTRQSVVAMLTGLSLGVIFALAVDAKGDEIMVSDNFDCPGSALIAAWEFGKPAGDNATVTRAGGALVINAVEASAYSAFTDGINAPTLLQAVENVDFIIEAKFNSAFAGTNQQTQGIMLLESANRFLRYDVSNLNGQPFLYAALINVGGAAANSKGQTGPPGISLLQPLIFRVTRTGDNWVFYYSIDGTAFTEWHSFASALAVSRAGVFIEKEANTAFAAQVDYFVEVHPDGPDCDANGAVDSRDIANGSALDCNGDRVIDTCSAPQDCNGNGVLDDVDIAAATSADCDANGNPDECDIASGAAGDANSNGVPDACEECVIDADCSDASWCNGEERCASGICVAGTAPCNAQAGETCNEASDWCETCTDGCSPVCTPTLALILVGMAALQPLRRRIA